MGPNDDASLTPSQGSGALRGRDSLFGLSARDFLVCYPALMALLLGAGRLLRRAVVDTPNGKVSLAAPPVLFSDGPRTLGPVPAIGEDSAAIRAEFGV